MLEPEELVVAALRLEGLSDAQIGELLGVSRAAVSRRMERGREQPRQRSPRNETPPLEHGWLCRWNGDPSGATHPHARGVLHPGAGLTAQDVAQRYGVAPQTVTRWIREGRFPHAYRAGGRRRDYRIPEGDW